MNFSEAPSSDAEVLRLFREKDNLGADSSLWLRAFRQLTRDGKPVGRVFCFTVPIGPDRKMPIGMLTLTKQNRLVFWPVLPRRSCCVVDNRLIEVPDHITIEFPSEKVHVTSYDANGKPIRSRFAWRSSTYGIAELRLLFTFLVRVSVLEDQDVLISRKFLSPELNKDRRTTELIRGLGDVVVRELPLPLSSNRQFVALSVHLTLKELTAGELPDSLIPMSAMNDLVNDWPEGAEFPLAVGQFKIHDHSFLLAAGYPPGKLKEELCFGFPRRTLVRSSIKGEAGR